MTALADDVADASDALEATTPPEIVGSEHARLIEATGAIEQGFRDVARASDEGDLDAADDALGVISANLDTTAGIFDELDVETSTAP